MARKKYQRKMGEVECSIFHTHCCFFFFPECPSSTPTPSFQQCKDFHQTPSCQVNQLIKFDNRRCVLQPKCLLFRFKDSIHLFLSQKIHPLCQPDPPTPHRPTSRDLQTDMCYRWIREIWENGLVNYKWKSSNIKVSSLCHFR